MDTFVSADSLEAAILAVSVVSRAVDRIVLSKSNANAFCLVRPPGHHAGYVGARAKCGQNGFCFLNNVVLGITHARLAWGLQRVAVIDIDVHYGNGTAELLRSDDQAFFASVHLKHDDFFPSDACIGPDIISPLEVSIGLKPLGYRKNTDNVAGLDGADPTKTLKAATKSVPVYCGSKGFRAALDQHVLPACRKFDPDIIFISAGFDGLATDPLGSDLGLSPEDYFWITRKIVQLSSECCSGRVISVMEGGYDTVSTRGRSCGLATAVERHVEALMEL